MRAVLAGERGAPPDMVVVLVDACNLTRNLVLVGELLAYGQPVVVALNMIDLAQRRGLIAEHADHGAAPWRARGADGGAEGRRPRCVAERGCRHARGRAADVAAERPAARGCDHGGAHGVGRRASLRNRASGSVDDGHATRSPSGSIASSRIRCSAWSTFAAVMAALFYTLFALATVPMDLIEATFASLGELVRSARCPTGPCAIC